MQFNLKEVTKPSFTRSLKVSSGFKKLIVVSSSGKGGTGKSTLSVNLALHYRSLGHLVGICDFNLHGGNVAEMLHVSDSKNITTWIKTPELFPDNLVEELMMESKEGIRVLPSLQCVDDEKLVNHQWLAEKIMKNLQHYDVVIVDAGPSFNQLTMEALRHATDIIMISEPDPIALNTIKKGLGYFKSKGIDSQKVRLVVNKVQNKSEKEMYRQVTEIDSVFEIPFEPKLQEWHSKQMRPLIDKRGSKMVKAIIDIADNIL